MVVHDHENSMFSLWSINLEVLNLSVINVKIKFLVFQNVSFSQFVTCALLSMVMTLLLLTMICAPLQWRCNLYYLPRRDVCSKKTSLRTLLSCALSEVMAWAAANLPHLSSPCVHSRKWASTYWNSSTSSTTSTAGPATCRRLVKNLVLHVDICI